MTRNRFLISLVSCLVLAPIAALGAEGAGRPFTLDAGVTLDAYRAAAEARLAGVLTATRTLAATEEAELVTLPAFTGGPEQLWRIDQLIDGTFRIMSKGGPKAKEPLALSAIGSSFATLSKFNPDSDKQRWHLKAP